MRNRPRLLLATTNPGKLHEIASILGHLPIRLATAAELGLNVIVAETGTTYAENASLKAAAYARASGLVALGDDSGLEVDALDGAPGLHTARYAGPGASDSDRYDLLLRRLEGFPLERRAARFRCVVAVAAPSGEVAIAEGVCEGCIALQPSGANGFGYDPVFYVDEYGCTLAELPDGVKNTISHRARALRAARPLLRAALHL